MNKFIILAGVWTCILIGGFTAIMLLEDRTGPAITVISSDIVYNQGEDKDTLLSYVTAVDQKDGDVTDTVMVADLLPLLNELSAKVVYVAEDKSNNVTKKEVYITYVPLKETAAEESVMSDEEAVSALKMSGGDIINNLSNSNNQADIPSGLTEGNQNRAEDSIGDTELDSNPVLVLASNEYTILRREEFNPKDLIETVSDDKDLLNYLMDHVTVVGNYDINTRGDYVLMYYTIDSDGNESEREYMVLTVE